MTHQSRKWPNFLSLCVCRCWHKCCLSHGVTEASQSILSDIVFTLTFGLFGSLRQLFRSSGHLFPQGNSWPNYHLYQQKSAKIFFGSEMTPPPKFSENSSFGNAGVPDFKAAFHTLNCTKTKIKKLREAAHIKKSQNYGHFPQPP